MSGIGIQTDPECGKNNKRCANMNDSNSSCVLLSSTASQKSIKKFGKFNANSSYYHAPVIDLTDDCKVGSKDIYGQSKQSLSFSEQLVIRVRQEELLSLRYNQQRCLSSEFEENEKPTKQSFPASSVPIMKCHSLPSTVRPSLLLSGAQNLQVVGRAWTSDEVHRQVESICCIMLRFIH
jgi:hypothetical protein